MPGKVVRRGGRQRRPKTRLKLPGDASFLRKNWSKRAVGWAQGRILYFALLAALLWGLNHLLTSADFQVSAARVSGNQMVSAQSVVEAASLKRESILLVDTNTVRDSVLKLPQIKEARVATQFPNQVVVQVTERTPAYIWKVNDTLYLASEDGILLGTAEKPDQFLPLVDVDARPVTVGDRVDSDALVTASRLSLLLPKELGITPTYYEYSSKEGVVVPTNFAGRVILGKSENLEEKVATFRTVAQKIKQDGIKVQAVDLRFKDRPYLR